MRELPQTRTSRGWNYMSCYVFHGGPFWEGLALSPSDPHKRLLRCWPKPRQTGRGHRSSSGWQMSGREQVWSVGISQTWSNSVQVRSTAAKQMPELEPMLADIGPTLVDVERISSERGPHLLEDYTKFADSGPASVDFTVCRARPEPGRIEPDDGRGVGPTLAGRDPGRGRIITRKACLHNTM